MNRIFRLVSIVIVSMLSYQEGRTQTNNPQKSKFESYSKTMDSLLLLSGSDSIAYCSPCVMFMEETTQIRGSIFNTVGGQKGFTNKDLIIWKQWYRRRFR